MPYHLFETEKEYRARLAEKQRIYRKHHDRSKEHAERTIKRRKYREDLKKIKALF